MDVWLHIYRGGARYQTWPNMYVWKTKLLVGALLVASVAIASCSDDAAPTGPEMDSEPGKIEVTVEGVIRDKETEAVLDGAEVRIYRGGQNEMLASGSANSEGVYSAAFILEDNDLPDELQIKAELDSFADYEREVRFARSVTHDIFLVAEDVERFAGGLGTADNPYLIETIDHLQNIDEELDAHFIQINNINATDTKEWNGGLGFNPIGTRVGQDDLGNRPFTGTYDGAGYEIYGLRVHRDQEVVGLFELVRTGEIKNVSLNNFHISGSGRWVGGLVGAMREGRIISCQANGEVAYTGERYGSGVALLVALNQDGSEIRSSHVSGTLYNPFGAAGGLASLSGGGISSWRQNEINESSSEIDISARGPVGGLVGLNSGGFNGGTIRYSKATGNIEATEPGPFIAGGLLGSNFGAIYDSYSIVTVTIQDDGNSRSVAGGLVGRNRGQIRQSYTASETFGEGVTGGLAGENDNGGTLLNTHWDVTAAGQDDGVGAGETDGTTGLTTDEMQGAAAEDNMDGFDFQEIWRTVTGDYPALQWEQQ